MTVPRQIEKYIAGQPEPKRGELNVLHALALKALPACRLWFDSGKNSEGKTVSNPTIGYGFHTMKYADGKTRDFFQLGLSANKTGISLYVLGQKDRSYLARMYGKALGQATVTGYCIKFRHLGDIDIKVLEAVIRYAGGAANEGPASN